MSGASEALQKVLYAALAGDAALMAAVTGIYDGVPAGAALPYVTIGPDTVSDAGWKGGTAYDHRLAVTVWTAGPGVGRAKALMVLVAAALSGVAGDAEGWRIVWLRPVRSATLAAASGAIQAILDVEARSTPD